MRKKHSRFSEEDRISLLRAYYQSGLSKHSFCKLHSLSGLRLLNYWIEKYGLLSRFSYPVREKKFPNWENIFS